MLQFTVYLGQADEVIFGDFVQLDSTPVDFNNLGINKVALVINDVATLTSDTDAIEIDTAQNQLIIKAGPFLTNIVYEKQTTARLVEYRAADDGGRTLLDGILVNIQP